MREQWLTEDFWKAADVANVEASIAAGCKPDAKDEKGLTALHYAAFYNESPKVIDALIEHGALINARDAYGGNPLHSAVQRNTAEMLDALIRHGVRVNAKDEMFGNTSLHWAIRNNRSPDIVAALLEAGADPNLENQDGKTAFDLIGEDSPLHGTDAYRRLKALQDQ